MSARGKTVPAIKRKEVICSCPTKCYTKISDDEANQVFCNFLDIGNKDLQDSLLFGLISSYECRQRRDIDNFLKVRSMSYRYTVKKINGESQKMCLQAFMAVYCVSHKRVCRLQAHMKNPDVASPPRDMWGKHGNHIETPNETKDSIREHIKSFPAIQSHYRRRQNPNRKYL